MTNNNNHAYNTKLRKEERKFLKVSYISDSENTKNISVLYIRKLDIVDKYLFLILIHYFFIFHFDTVNFVFLFPFIHFKISCVFYSDMLKLILVAYESLSE